MTLFLDGMEITAPTGVRNHIIRSRWVCKSQYEYRMASFVPVVMGWTSSFVSRSVPL